MYLWFLFSLFVYVFASLFGDVKNSSHIKLLLILILTFLAAFRFDVGTDYQSYAILIEQIESGDVSPVWANKEKGFFYLVEFLLFLGANSQAVFMVFSIATVIFYFRGLAVYRFDGRLQIFSILVFMLTLYFYMLNGIRQALAISIFFFALKYIIERKILMYLVFLVFASFFHKTALVLIPFFWLLRIPLPFALYLVGVAAVSILHYSGGISAMLTYYHHLKLPYYYYTVVSPGGNDLYDFAVLVSSFLLLCTVYIWSNLRGLMRAVVLNGFYVYIILKSLSGYSEVFVRAAFYFKIFSVPLIMSVAEYWMRRYQKDWGVIYVFFLSMLLSMSIAGIIARAQVDASYNNYAINMCFIGDPCPIYFGGKK
tara:strand:- start:2605 stop:3711 length:1107 start_codon:yes stop_codon:yes gene_type:complete